MFVRWIQWNIDKVTLHGVTPEEECPADRDDGQKELDAMVAEFDREFVAESFGPMDSTARARLGRAKRKRGRPRVGAGSRMVSVTIEKRLLKRVDR